MVMMDLPGTYQGFRNWSGNQPMPVDSADGATFWGVMAKNESTGFLYALCLRQDASGALTIEYQSQPIAPGAGMCMLALQPTGKLVFAYFETAGDGKPVKRVVIDSYKAFPAGGGGTVPPHTHAITMVAR